MYDTSSVSDPPTGSDWLKADLHLHTAEDQFDAVDYSASDLIDMAVAAGIGILAITLHRQVWSDEWVQMKAAERGVLLIPGVELRIEGADVVLLNARSGDVERADSFEALRALRAERGNEILTILPHPFYVIGGSMGSRAEAWMDCFDAVEHCHFHTRILNPNRRAVRLASKFRKPMVATSDSHRRIAFGRHYSWVRTGGTPSVTDVFASIRSGDVRRVSPPCSIKDFLSILHFIFVGHPARKRRLARANVSNRRSYKP